MLDENGNPIDPQKVVVDKEMFDKLSALPDVVNNLVEELKTERKAKQDAEARADATIANAAPAKSDDPEDPEMVVRRILGERDQNSVKTARVTAEENFKNTHKEFHPDNDPGGLKYQAFERSLAKINLSGATSESQFSDLFETALLVMNKGVVAPSGETITPYADDASTPGGTPQSRDNNALTPKEHRLIKSMPGWTEEKYLKMKKSRPGYVESLLQYAK